MVFEDKRHRDYGDFGFSSSDRRDNGAAFHWFQLRLRFCGNPEAIKQTQEIDPGSALGSIGD